MPALPVFRFLVLAMVCSVALSTPAASPQPLVLTHATVIDVESRTLRDDTDIVIEGTRITSLENGVAERPPGKGLNCEEKSRASRF